MLSTMSDSMTNMTDPHSDHTSQVNPGIFSGQKNRLQTFKRKNVEEALPAISLSNAGFVQPSDEGELDVIECLFCGLKLRNLDLSHNPLVWHRVYSRSCPFLKFNKHVNVRDLGISFPENSALAVDLGPVVLRSGPLEGGSMEDDDDEEMPSNGSQAEPHITISHDVPDRGSDGDSTTPTSAEELNKLYHSLDQLPQVLPKSHIDVIKKPLAQIESLLSTFAYERHRRLTFNNWPKKDTVSPRALAASGFVYFHDSEDTVECVFCKVHIGNWTADMVPDVVHMKKSKHCQFMKGARTVRNIPDIAADIFDDDPTGLPSNVSELGIITETAKHSEFAVEDRRKATFLTWPSANHKLASEMIEHQLFYTGHGDVVCCFSCGIEMSGWTSTDNIWRRHARQAPHCQLVIQEKGAEWVAATIEEHGRYQTEKREPAIDTVTTTMLRPRLDSPAVQSLLQMTISEDQRNQIRYVISQRIKSGDPDFTDTASIIRAIQQHQEERRQIDEARTAKENEPAPPQVVCDGGKEALPDSLSIMENPLYPADPSALKELGRSVKNQVTCKICFQVPVEVAFLPCCHAACCSGCAAVMPQCPICRQEIKNTVPVNICFLDK